MEPLQLIGYFPKKVVLRPEWLDAPIVKAIRSVSTCISGGPDNWINRWLHNYEWFLFSSNTLAIEVVPESEREQYEVHAYRIFPMEYRDGRADPVTLPDVKVEPLPDSYFSIGFDAVARSDSPDMPEFGCSPLSCNHMASEIETNEHCLLDDFNMARQVAMRFSREKPEPGTYYVVEVLMQINEPV